MSTQMSLAASTQDARSLVAAIGIGDFNATMVIPYVFLTPANTDPDMPPVRLLVQGIQRVLRQMGASTVSDSGMLQAETATELRRLTGPNWTGMTWGTIIETTLRARDAGRRLDPVKVQPAELETLGFLPDLPAVPGGMWTLAAAGVAAYYLFFKRKR